MFERPKVPRVIRMHVSDAGHGDSMGAIVRWQCRKCGHETDWDQVGEASVTKLKRGIPCPKCNSH